jgi:AcrR family transcriptional regulator
MIEELQPTSRREQAKGGRRARIVEATYSLLREHGIADLSVKMIADQAGVSPATVYNLFGTKATVLEKVYERDLAEFEQRTAKVAYTDSLARIFDCVAIIADHYRSDPRLYRSISRMPNAEPADVELIDAVRSSRSHFWVDLVRKAVQDGHLKPDTDATRLSLMMVYLNGGALGGWVSNFTSIDHYEQHVTYGFACLLWPFATKATQQRLQEKLDARPAPASRRKVKSQA